MASSVCTSMQAVREYFRFAHIDGLIPSDPAACAWLSKIYSVESRTHGLDRFADRGSAELVWSSTSPIAPARYPV